MAFSYPIGSVVSSGGFTGTGQAANVEVSLGDLGVIPAFALSVGTIIEFEIGLRATLVSNALARNLQIRLRMGGLTGAVLLDTTMLALPVSTAFTGAPMILRGHLTQRTVGASGTASCAATMPNRLFNAAIDKTHPFPGPWALSTYSTLVPQAVTLTVTESSNAVADQVGMESALLIAFKV